jgi:hypothetical protein
MGGLTHDYLWWWNFFKEYLFAMHQFQKGTIVLPHGQNEIFVPTEPGKQVTQVYLSSGEKGVPVCVGDVDLMSALVVDEGFIIYADIKSEYCQVLYLWTYWNPDPDSPPEPPRP